MNQTREFHYVCMQRSFIRPKHSLKYACHPHQLSPNQKDLKMRDKRQCGPLCCSLSLSACALLKSSRCCGLLMWNSPTNCARGEKKKNSFKECSDISFVLPLCLTKIKFHKRKQRKKVSCGESTSMCKLLKLQLPVQAGNSHPQLVGQWST